MDIPADTCGDTGLLLPPVRKPWFPYRYKLAVLVFLGFFNCIAVRFNFNIAMVAMANYTNADAGLNISDECPAPPHTNSSSTDPQGDFPWDADTQGQLMAAFFYGYVFTQLPGGYLAEVFGAKIVIGSVVLLPGLLTLLTPLVARWNVMWLMGLRILMGVMQGALYPANHALWGQWAPELERSQLTAWASAGAPVGMIVTTALTGYLCTLDFMGGWPISFYLFGGTCVLWFVVWVIFAHDSPKQHKGLSQYEKLYIEEHNTASQHVEDTKSGRRPWLAMLTSVPVWAIIFYSLTDGIGFYILVSGVPIYLKQILRFDISSDGFLSSVPYLGNFLTVIIAGPIADWFRSKKYMTTGTTRKVFAFIGEGGVGAFLVAMAFVECDRIIAVALLICAFTIYGFSFASQPVNQLDIAPAYAGTLMGISNTFANIGGFMSPYIVSKMTRDQPVRRYWQHTFFVAAGVYALGTLVWLLFSSGEEQEWAKKRGRAKQEEEEEGDGEEAQFINASVAGQVQQVQQVQQPGMGYNPDVHVL